MSDDPIDVPSKTTPDATPAPEIEITVPEGLPLKFWDDTTKNVRLGAMIKSYGDLERRLGAPPVSQVPDSPDDYALVLEDLPLQADSQVNARLHQAGFTRDQARMVYELANEKLAPLLAGLTQDYEVQAQVELLEKHFGGAEKWRETSRQLKSWGQANLPPQVFDVLSASRDGVLTLHRMMETGEPGIGKGAGTGPGMGENSVKDLMNSPRYWRDRDAATVEQVRQGFKALYPEN